MIVNQSSVLDSVRSENHFTSPDTERSTARRLAGVFVLYGLIATAFLAVKMPPFQNPDEPNHFMRAAQLADGGLVGTRFSQIAADGSLHILAGGPVDPAINTAFLPFDALRFHPNVKTTQALLQPCIYWSSTRVLADFPNTAVYPPVFYVPSAIGVLVGRNTKMSVVQTLVVSRLLTGVTAVALAAVAIAIAGGAAAWIFTILTLPMSLSLIASSSQDALLLACSALAAALMVQALRRSSACGGVRLTALVVMLGLVGIARPPYGALAILPLGLQKVQLRWRILMAMAVAACVSVWSWIAAATTLTNYAAFLGADPSAQLARLRDDPLLAVTVVWKTLIEREQRGLYFEEFIGVLGWLDTFLPPAYYLAAGLMLIIAAVATTLGIKGERIRCPSILAVAAGLLLSSAGMFIIMYVIWTPPGSATVAGLQGRYFLPLALVGVALLPALGNTRTARLQKVLIVLLAAFPVVSLAIVMRAVVLRYYLG